MELRDELLNEFGCPKAIAILKKQLVWNRADYYRRTYPVDETTSSDRAFPSNHPKITFLADEPMHWTKKSGRDVVELMQKLAEEQGYYILLVATHDNRILDGNDRIIYMEDGHLVVIVSRCWSRVPSHQKKLFLCTHSSY